MLYLRIRYQNLKWKRFTLKTMFRRMLETFEKWNLFESRELGQLGTGQRAVHGISSMEKRLPRQQPEIAWRFGCHNANELLWRLFLRKMRGKNSFSVHNSTTLNDTYLWNMIYLPSGIRHQVYYILIKEQKSENS